MDAAGVILGRGPGAARAPGAPPRGEPRVPAGDVGVAPATSTAQSRSCVFLLERCKFCEPVGLPRFSRVGI